jgi:hypothetical protein
VQILGTPLDRIDFAFVDRLVQDRIDESVTHDYKARLPDKKDIAAKARLARSACAFANTRGGVLVLGVDSESTPWSIPGLDQFDSDNDVTRMVQILRSAIDPPLPRVEPRIISADDGRQLLLLGVPHSFAAPHRVLQEGHFYARAPRTNVEMTVEELRRAFDEADAWRRDVETFLERRWAFVLDGRFIGDVNAELPSMFLHVLPLGRLRASVDSQQLMEFWRSTQPLRGDELADEQRPNVDGWLRFVRTHTQDLRYLQAFRNGGTESCWSLSGFHTPGGKNLDGARIEARLFDRVSRTIESMAKAGVGAPYLVNLRLNRPSGLSLSFHDGFTKYSSGFDRDTVDVPSIVIEEEPSTQARLAAALRPLFDAHWQSSGFGRDPYYEEKTDDWRLLTSYDRYF